MSLPLRPSLRPSQSLSLLTPKTQIRNASLLRRPHRPYTFTQLVRLSDGSHYLTRTTSPLPIYRSSKDVRNNALWQPSLSSLKNVEEDEAGKLRAFRRKFGRGWDAEGETDGEGDLMDLISTGSKETKEKSEGGMEESQEEEATVVKRDKDGNLIKVKVLAKDLKSNREKKDKGRGWGGTS